MLFTLKLQMSHSVMIQEIFNVKLLLECFGVNNTTISFINVGLRGMKKVLHLLLIEREFAIKVGIICMLMIFCQWYSSHLTSLTIQPDKWEYPFFAAWDTAFHCIPLAMIDPDFAKRQLALLTREWYMHPNGELPAYEWGFGDVNPPVHAWATMRVYQIEQKMFGRTDRLFLERVFQKLLMNFTWWCNRKDAEGNNVFQGGFLGLDNISVFDRNQQLPDGGHLDQADGTAWMGVYCLSMLGIAAELARDNRAYEDIASKFFEHFIYISDAINHMGDDDAGVSLWD